MKICIFGDSLTWGASDAEKGGWAIRLRNALEEQGSVVYALGIPGNTTTDVATRLNPEAISRQPDVIIFAIGTNDAQFIHSKNAFKVSPETTQENLKKLTEQARQLTKNVIFIGLTYVDETKTCPVAWNRDKSYTNKAIKERNLMIEEHCRQNSIPFIPMDGLITDTELHDGIHPNTMGHESIFQRVIVGLKKLEIVK